MEKKNAANDLDRLERLILELPDICQAFFNDIGLSTTTKTCIAYARDLNLFFYYLEQKKGVTDISWNYIDSLKAEDFTNFIRWTERYTDRNDIVRTNNKKAMARKLSSVKSFCKWAYAHEYISSNASSLVSHPKIVKEEILVLEPHEQAKMLDVVENPTVFKGRQSIFAERTRKRDFAIITLLLGTGIRVSECVGINIKDINFENSEITIRRKGGKVQSIFFSDEVAEALKEYIFDADGRNKLLGGVNEDALFISGQKRRITARSIERIVSKYSFFVTSKKITPHKLRSTYGTSLYEETGDIKLVADVLGHESITTANDYYVRSNIDKRRNARNVVKIREEIYPGEKYDNIK